MIFTAAMSDLSEHPEDEIDLFSPRQYRLSLWYFLFDLLEKKGTEKIIIWANRDELEFKIVNTDALARAWGKLKGKTNMTYPKFSRAMRYYYRKNVIQKINGKRFTYRFIESDLTHDVFKSFNCGVTRQACGVASQNGQLYAHNNPTIGVSYIEPDKEAFSSSLSQSTHSIVFENTLNHSSSACANPSSDNLIPESYDNSERRRSSAALMEELIKQAVAGKSFAQMNRANDLNNKPYLEILTEEDFSSFKNTDEFGKSCNNEIATTEAITQSLAQAVPYVNSVNCSWGTVTDTYCSASSCDIEMEQTVEMPATNFCSYPFTFTEDMYQ